MTFNKIMESDVLCFYCSNEYAMRIPIKISCHEKYRIDIMTKPVLYILKASPPAHAVRIVAELLGVQLELKEPNWQKMEHKSPEYKKINPMGTIPVLIDEDFVISESNAIMKYLVGKYGGESQKLYPSDLREQAIVDQCLFFNTGVYFIRLKVVALPTLLQGLKGPSQKQLEDIETAYEVVEAYLQDRDYIATNYLTLADIAVGTTTTFMQPILKLDTEKFPRTAAWLSRLDKEPAFKKYSDFGSEAFGVALNHFWKINNEKK